MHAWVQVELFFIFLFAMHVCIYRIMASKRAIQRKQELLFDRFDRYVVGKEIENSLVDQKL